MPALLVDIATVSGMSNDYRAAWQPTTLLLLALYGGLVLFVVLNHLQIKLFNQWKK
jgi:hypothetical protein